ncbi:Rop guanine nucleotide exchange factor 2 [Acorus calamus]|uniref:Rop guanine nucleotide exchange factor 2 n=1 Tax=Acorus calamus TaxID=4465 RepID=A0AAV9CPP3_ACOCL|nr:Rop guanine nucleotide exchange factor 2 [Acorus calamus]
MTLGLKETEDMDRTMSNDRNSERDYSPCSKGRITRSNTDTGFSIRSSESFEYSRTASEVSTYSGATDEHSISDEPRLLGWPFTKSDIRNPVILSKLGAKQNNGVMERKSDGDETSESDLQMMKERFSKLLLGEDMSGSGKATVFGQCWRLEPLSPEKKSMWRKEMDCLLSVCDYIVEFVPTFQNYSDGTALEVMSSRPRSDIHINLPALQKLDAMLLEILESFLDKEFWYMDQDDLSSISNTSKSFRMVVHRNEEKWWLPVPCVPPCGLHTKTSKELRHKRESVNQIHKAAMAINNSILAEMEVPETYLGNLPKSGRASLGDGMYRHIFTTDSFSPDHLLNCLNITSEHEALEITDRVEASMYIWRRKASMQHSKCSWDMVKDLMADGDKNVILARRADDLLLCIKRRYPELSQTTLDTCKIQYNKDVGQAILESYSRVLETLAFNIVALIDDVLHVDGTVKRPIQ